MKELKEKLEEIEKVKTLAIDALSCMDAFGTDDWNIILTRDMAKSVLSSMGDGWVNLKDTGGKMEDVDCLVRQKNGIIRIFKRGESAIIGEFTHYLPNPTNPMNKEQILETALDNHHVSGLVEEDGRIWKAILQAMEEYRNQPPKSAVVKSPEDYLSEQGPYGEYVYSPDALAALTAQAQDFEGEMEDAINWIGRNCDRAGENEWNVIYGVPEPIYGLSFSELLTQFRNQKPRG